MKVEKILPSSVSGGSFIVLTKFLRALTSGEQKMKSYVDYYLGFLVYENIHSINVS